MSGECTPQPKRSRHALPDARRPENAGTPEKPRQSVSAHMMAVALEKAASGRFQARIAAEKASALSSEKAAAEEELAKVNKRL